MHQQETISDLLQAEHQWIDERFQEFQRDLSQGRVNADPFQAAQQVLHRHIYLEEEILFPAVEVRGLVGPTVVMAQEHGRICQLLGHILGLIEKHSRPEPIHDAFSSLNSLLGEHNAKEERILYPTADHLLGQNGLASIMERLKEANPPSGWACRAHR